VVRGPGSRRLQLRSNDRLAKLNAQTLSHAQVVLFLDTRPDDPAEREAFSNMLHGGAWMGFHFAGFALTPSKYPQDWDWYTTSSSVRGRRATRGIHLGGA
jgi:hypothetical protein